MMRDLNPGEWSGAGAGQKIVRNSRPHGRKNGRLRMSIVFEIRARIDPGKANLLESIRDTGSISAAAGDIDMTHIRAACCSTAPTLPAAASDQVELVGTAASPPAGRCDGASRVFATLGLQLERVRAAQACGTRVVVWFQDEARIGQKNSLTRVWGQTGSRPAAPKDLGFAPAYV
jgi:hypothetical protein